MIENGDYKISIERRITELSIDFREFKCKVNEDIAEIRDNHLSHLSAKVDRIQWLLLTTLLAAVMNLAFLTMSKFL